MENWNEDIKLWCKDMMDIYLEHWSENDEIYIELKQFYDENRITGIIDSESSKKDIEEYLEFLAKSINYKYIKKFPSKK